MADERQIVQLVDRNAADAESFEFLSTAVETGESSGLPSELAKQLGLYDDDDVVEDGLAGLELGVAGLVLALNAAGVITAASCRGHHYRDRRSWSDRPVVYFAADRPQVGWLAPMAEASGCGFMIDTERPNLLVIEAPSVVSSMEMARLVIDATAERRA